MAALGLHPLPDQRLSTSWYSGHALCSWCSCQFHCSLAALFRPAYIWLCLWLSQSIPTRHSQEQSQPMLGAYLFAVFSVLCLLAYILYQRVAKSLTRLSDWAELILYQVQVFLFQFQTSKYTKQTLGKRVCSFCFNYTYGVRETLPGAQCIKLGALPCPLLPRLAGWWAHMVSVRVPSGCITKTNTIEA